MKIYKYENIYENIGCNRLLHLSCRADLSPKPQGIHRKGSRYDPSDCKTHTNIANIHGNGAHICIYVYKYCKY